MTAEAETVELREVVAASLFLASSPNRRFCFLNKVAKDYWRKLADAAIFQIEGSAEVPDSMWPVGERPEKVYVDGVSAAPSQPVYVPPAPPVPELPLAEQVPSLDSRVTEDVPF